VADSYLEVKDWAGGIISSMPSDQIPDNAYTEGYNTAFVKVGGGATAIGSRPGLVTVNDTAFSGSPAVHFKHLYSYASGGSWTRYSVVVCADGTLRYKNPNDTFTSTLSVPANFPSPSTLCFTAGTTPVSAAVFNNRLLLLNDDGEKRSLVGQTYVPWGLNDIATWTAASAATGVNSMPDETYDLVITSYNSTSGGESSSATYVSVAMGGANRRIKVDIAPTAAESAQYTHWRIGLRRQTTQAELYQVMRLRDVAGTSIVTDGNIPIATLTAYVDLSSASIAALTTVMPSTTENDGPSSAVKHVAVYGGRVITSDGSNVYWSKYGKADNFRPQDYEPINTGEGDEIVGFAEYSDELLVVFLSTATWGIYGSDPQTWVFKPIDQTVGLAGRNTVVLVEGKLAWWDEAVGPVVFDGTTLTHVGMDLLGSAAVTTDLSISRLPYAWGSCEPTGSRILWSVSSAGATRNDRLIPYNYKLGKFEATYWNPIDAASLHLGFNAAGELRLFLGSYAGQVFEMDPDTKLDGIPGGIYTGSFTPTTTSITTITSSGFYNTNSKLVERRVVLVDEDFRFVAQRRITSNTSTVLTLDSAITGLTLDQTYTFFVGGPNFRLFTKWYDQGQPFLRKRFDRLYFHMGSTTGVQNTYVTTQVEFSSSSDTESTAFSVNGAVWDEALWDVAQWSLASALKRRLSISRNATVLRANFAAYMPNRDITLYKVAVLSRLLSDRYYG